MNRSKSGSVTTPLFNFISLHFPSSSQLSPKLNHLLFPAYAGFPTSGRSSSCFFPWCGSSSPNNALLQSESESLSRSVVSDSVTPRTVAYQAPLSMEFFRQEDRSGSPHPSPGNIPHPGIKPRSPALRADSLSPELPEKPLLQKHRVNIKAGTSLVV